MKRLGFLTAILLTLNLNIFCLSSNIIVRPAIESDLSGLLELDTKVSYEFFKPLFVHYYSHLKIGQESDYWINKWLEDDLINFKACIYNNTNNSSSERVLIAYDIAAQSCIGLLMFHKEDTHVLEIDILMIDVNYRNQGIGKNLVSQAISYFKGIKSCIVHVFMHGNNNTLKFYESIGFKGLGKTINNKAVSLHLPDILYSDLYFLYKLDIN